jgi:hypothetical protein
MSGVANGKFDDSNHVAFQFQQQHSFEMSESRQIPSSWILLDNQSTVDGFHNDNIRDREGFVAIHCNAGITSKNLVGNLPGYGEVWYNPNGITNILLLSKVKERGFWVTFDSDTGNKLHVHKIDGNKRVFQQSKRGLYHMDTNTTGITLVNTVEGNKYNFSNTDNSRALLAPKVQKINH